jgi:hypothetical protein
VGGVLPACPFTFVQHLSTDSELASTGHLLCHPSALITCLRIQLTGSVTSPSFTLGHCSPCRCHRALLNRVSFTLARPFTLLGWFPHFCLMIPSTVPFPQQQSRPRGWVTTEQACWSLTAGVNPLLRRSFSVALTQLPHLLRRIFCPTCTRCVESSLLLPLVDVSNCKRPPGCSVSHECLTAISSLHNTIL